jgi:hypothetical protein
MSEMPCVKVGQRMIEEARICVVWTYSYHVDNSWDEVGCECNDECLKKYEENLKIVGSFSSINLHFDSNDTR